MPARDIYHDAVRSALLKDGWSITHDPFRLAYGGKDMYVDLGAERLVAAEKQGRRIAVEIKSFVGESELRDIEQAIGQFVVYRAVLAEIEPDRQLFIAVPDAVLQDVFLEPLGELLLARASMRVLGFDPAAEVVTRWIP
jgi:XisH protein